MTRREEEIKVLVEQIDRALDKPGCDSWRVFEALRRVRVFLLKEGRGVLTESPGPG